MPELPDDFLDRCFRRVRSAPTPPLPEGAPTGFATRVIAHCGGTGSPRDWTLWLLPRAIGFAAAGVAVLFALHAFHADTVDESELGSLVMNVALEAQP
jgi:hypothetical protein